MNESRYVYDVATDPRLHGWRFDLRYMVTDRDDPCEGARRAAIRQMRTIERIMPMADFIGILARRAMLTCMN